MAKQNRWKVLLLISVFLALFLIVTLWPHQLDHGINWDAVERITIARTECVVRNGSTENYDNPRMAIQMLGVGFFDDPMNIQSWEKALQCDEEVSG
ncbi:MAG: hypothetical protein ACK5H4_25530 [Lacrimispora sphenoides]